MTTGEIRELFDYTEWGNDLVLAAAKKLTADQVLRDVGISHHSILGTLSHMAGAEWIWLERWHGRSPAGNGAWAQWTPAQCKDLRILREKWQPIIDLRRTYLAKLKDADLPVELAFKRLNGDAGSMPLVQQLQHVVNHATLHRGQVVGMIRQLGFTPPATDLLFYWMARPRSGTA
jgi:uncharacterized damage-inducible protein DinB